MLIFNKKYQNKAGFSLVETLLASSLFIFIIAFVINALIYSQDNSRISGDRNRAVLLAEEGVEAIRNLRDENFNNLTDGTYGLIQNPANEWELSPTPDVTDIFTRQITISTPAANKKQILSTITWSQNNQRQGNISLESILTNFKASTGGQLPSWANPGLANSHDLLDIANGSTVIYQNDLLYFGRVNSLNTEFIIYNIISPDSPLIIGQRDLLGTPNDIVIYQNYAYIASTDDGQELQIINISNPNQIQQPSNLTFVDLTRNNSGHATADATNLAIVDSYLLMTRADGDNFLIFNLSNPANPGSPIGRNRQFTGIPTDMVTSGNYAYITSTDDLAELQVFNIANKTKPTRLASLDLNNGSATSDALSIAIKGNYAYIGRVQSSSAPEVYIIDLTQPSNPSIVGTLEIGANVSSLTISQTNNYLFASTSDINNDFKVIDITSQTAPVIYGQLNIDDSPQDMDYDPSLDRVFISSSSDSQELQIIKPSIP